LADDAAGRESGGFPMADDAAGRESGGFPSGKQV